MKIKLNKMHLLIMYYIFVAGYFMFFIKMALTQLIDLRYLLLGTLLVLFAYALNLMVEEMEPENEPFETPRP